MYLEEQIARDILNLNPSGTLDDAITERQFQVILKGFNHLYQPQHNFLYLADEVGLGKTYLALGIMSLFRHFSDNPDCHSDLILVPKKNLQEKWQKELHQFVRDNYLLPDSLVKSVMGSPVALCGNNQLHNCMEPVAVKSPSYEIFRSSSFSQALNRDHCVSLDAWKTLVEERASYFRDVHVKGHSLEHLFRRAVKSFGSDRDHALLRTRCYVYLLNATLPNIDLLVVDEAHNFKGGYTGNDTLRNNAMARFLGIVPHGEDRHKDDAIFEAIPELAELVRPVVKKVLLLSATPLDYDLNDIKQQLDCFLPEHSFRDANNGHHDYLRSVLIRGLMEIKVDGHPYSRNMYRHEHRNGNVRKDDERPQKIEKDLDNLILGVMQYRTIRHLKQKNNASFELGMLAGFESFAASAPSSKGKVFEDSTSKDNEAVDENIIRSLVQSYQKKFNQTIPHVKQDALAKELVERMINGEKSLVFVRRVASTRELESKIADFYACHIHDRLVGSRFLNRYRSPQLDQMLKAFDERKRLDDINQTLKKVAERICQYDRNSPGLIARHEATKAKYPTEKAEKISDWLVHQVLEVYHSVGENSQVDAFREMTDRHLHRERIDADYRELALQLVLINKDPELDDAFVEELDESDNASYFFSEFFLRNPEGQKFRKRMYSRSWFDLNFFLINEKYRLVDIDKAVLANVPEIPDNISKESQKSDFYQERIRESIRSGKNTECSVAQVFTDTTFLTEILMNICTEHFSQWVENIRELFGENPENGLLQIDILNDLLKGIFRNGPGLLPAFIVETKYRGGEEFPEAMTQMLLEYFPEVISEVEHILKDFELICAKNLPKRNAVGNLMRGLEPVTGISGQHRKSVSRTAAQFRMPGWPLVLITTDILKEGEDLHLYCKDVFHYGIAWKASDMDQRNGRIDRIGSMSYRKIKASDRIDSDSMVHVFVPYLADTLEVNQVSRVFHGIDQFVRTFYDFTDVTKQESSASTEDVVSMIPSQIQERLFSKFDHEHFKSYRPDCEPLTIRKFRGPTAKEILEQLNQLVTCLSGQGDYFYGPKMDNANFRIVGDLIIEHDSGSQRRGPFSLMVTKGSSPGEYMLKIISQICEERGRTKREKEQIYAHLSQRGYTYNIYREHITAVDTCSLGLDIVDLAQRLKDLVLVADQLEFDLIGQDLNVIDL